MAKTSFAKVIPAKTLEEAIKVGKAIVDFNGGKPIDTLTLAECMKNSPTSSTFFQTVSSSQMYGLTSGSAYSKSISLTTLGKDYFYFRSPEEKKNALFKAATHPPLVKRIYEHFNKNKLPPFEMAKNILTRSFGIHEKKIKNAWNVIRKNAMYTGFLQEISGNEYINLDKVEIQESLVKPETEIPEEGVTGEVVEEGQIGDTGKPPFEVPEPEVQQPMKVFIGHGKNKKVMDQIKTTLEFGGYEPIIAEAKETTAIPVPEKVMSAMHECQAGIINISADEPLTDSAGNEIYQINDNVLLEIGSAFVLYKKKVILVVDKKVELPSNLQGLYVCYYEGDSLDWESGLKLQKALTEFKK